MKRILLGDRGAVAIIVALSMVALAGFTAFVIDIGNSYSEKVKLNNAIDAAVLAGSQEYVINQANTMNVIEQLLNENGVDISQVSVTIAPVSGTTQTKISITGETTVNHWFAPIIGIENTDVHANAASLIGNIGSARNVKPFGIEDFEYTFGDLVTLKMGSDDAYQGNFGLLALGGTGTDILLDNTFDGYSEYLAIGDVINTEPGNVATIIPDIGDFIDTEPSTFDPLDPYSIDPGSIRLWTVPIVDYTGAAGRSDPIEVLGFAKVYVEAVYKDTGDMTITARFVEYYETGTIDPNAPDTGLYTSMLVE